MTTLYNFGSSLCTLELFAIFFFIRLFIAFYQRLISMLTFYNILVHFNVTLALLRVWMVLAFEPFFFSFDSLRLKIPWHKYSPCPQNSQKINCFNFFNGSEEYYVMLDNMHRWSKDSYAFLLLNQTFKDSESICFP